MIPRVLVALSDSARDTFEWRPFSKFMRLPSSPLSRGKLRPLRRENFEGDFRSPSEGLRSGDSCEAGGSVTPRGYGHLDHDNCHSRLASRSPSQSGRLSVCLVHDKQRD